jgi:YegS/Rv2252/BmrU family lipid kinase
MKIRFILNPVSGRNARTVRLRPLLLDYIRDRSLDAELHVTDGPGHAVELARNAVQVGCQRVVAIGGDGTLNEVAQGLVHTPAALALVPCGSGNGLALHLGIPLAPRAALELAAASSARITAIDTGSVNGHPFFNAMGLGLDADISLRFNQLTTRGLPAYVSTGFSAFNQRRSQRCKITVGNRTEVLDILLIAIANSDQYGNRAFIAPGASVVDGQLDLIAIRPVNHVGAAFLGSRLFLGTIDHSPDTFRLRGTRFIIERPAPGLVHTDGETHETGAKVDVCVHPQSLRIVVPALLRGISIPAKTPSADFAPQPL